MEHTSRLILEGILRDMSEGIMHIDLKGVIRTVNPATGEILGVDPEELVGSSFAKSFFYYSENDDFNQLVMDSIYESGKTHRGVVPFFTGKTHKFLHVATSLLRQKGERIGIILVFNDITSLIELQEENRRMAEEALEALHAFVQVMVTAIESRSPYNANHTRNMVRFAQRFLDWAAENDSQFRTLNRDPFLISVWLHDIGKLGIPLEIMDKPTRLGDLEEGLMFRIQTGLLMERIRALEDPERREEAEARRRRLKDARALIRRCNRAPFMTDELLQELRKLSSATCLTAQGDTIPLLTNQEMEALSIRRGTLTVGERRTMESHVELSARMLAQMHLPTMYRDVPRWASSHHELLDGSGYPNHLSGDDIPPETRLLTILDIFEALTATDRPYKPSMPVPMALDVLESMRDGGKLDGAVLEEFMNSGTWELADYLQHGGEEPHSDNEN